MAIGQAVVSSVLKNNTLIETSEDVSGVLGLCAVLVRDQKDSTSASGPRGRQAIDYREMAEEQGWVARMVHLFKSDDLAVQFEVSSALLVVIKLMFSYYKPLEDISRKVARGYDILSLHLSLLVSSLPGDSSSVNMSYVLVVFTKVLADVSGGRLGGSNIVIVQIHPSTHHNPIS